MHRELASSLPKDKCDTKQAEVIVGLGFPMVEPVLPALMEWMQDINWPVAQTLQPFLASIGPPLAPHVRHVLATDDQIWKRWVVRWVVGESASLAIVLAPELLRLATWPTGDEREEELDLIAREILSRYCSD